MSVSYGSFGMNPIHTVLNNHPLPSGVMIFSFDWSEIALHNNCQPIGLNKSVVNM